MINESWICFRFFISRFVIYRFVRYRLGFLHTDITIKHFVCLQDVLKTASMQQFFVFQDVFKMTWKTKTYYADEGVFKICLEDVLKRS